MNSTALDALAASAGVQRHWTDVGGNRQTVADDDLRAVLDAVGWPCASESDIRDSLQRQRGVGDALPPLVTTSVQRPGLPRALRGAMLRIEWEQGGSIELRRDRDGTIPPLPRKMPMGYHRLQHADGETILAVAPTRCFGMADLMGAAPRLWGPVAQIPALRGHDDPGFGDFASLSQCAVEAGAAGAGALATSPVHALFLADPARCSPYSPSSRRCLNALYADPRVAFSEEAIAAARTTIGETAEGNDNRQPLIDWPAGSRRKLSLLRQLYATQAVQATQAPRRYDPGDPVHVHACFETLHAHLSHAAGRVLPLAQWPTRLASPQAAAVREFAGAHSDELQFHIWLQRLAARSLAQVQHNARDAGMPLGLVADLAIGSDPDGSDMWAMRPHMLAGVGIGAPPDPFNRHGQAWGLTTFSPLALGQQGYAPWLGMLRANLRAAGGIRIDHAMGLARLWLVPQDRPANHGAYVRMPAEDLLRLLALESWRHRAVVIGEDLGTVPPMLRQRLHEHGLLGMSVLWFQREGEAFLPPARWPKDAVAMSGTHDLPTLAGWWRGRDLELQAKVHDTVVAQDDLEQRQRDRDALWQSLHQDKGAAGEAALSNRAAKLQVPSFPRTRESSVLGRVEAQSLDSRSREARSILSLSKDVNDEPGAPSPDQPAPFVDAVCAALAASPAPLLLLPMEDLAASEEQVNLPGSTDAWPNWRLRHDDRVDVLFARADVHHRLRLLARERVR